MATLADLQVTRAALVEARMNGLRAVQYSDSSRIEYKTDSEMESALAALDREIASASSPRVAQIRVMGRGLKTP